MKRFLSIFTIFAISCAIWAQNMIQDRPIFYDSSINRQIDFSYLHSYYKMDIRENVSYCIDFDKMKLFETFTQSLNTSTSNNELIVNIYNIESGEKIDTIQFSQKSNHIGKLTNSCYVKGNTIIIEYRSWNEYKIAKLDLANKKVENDFRIISSKPGIFYSDEYFSYYLYFESRVGNYDALVFDLDRRSIILRNERGSDPFYPDYSFSPDGTYLFVYDRFHDTNSISVWDISNRAEVSRLSLKEMSFSFSTPIKRNTKGYYSFEVIGYSLDNKRAIVFWDKYMRAAEINFETKKYRPILVDTNSVGFNKAVYYDDEKIMLRDNNGILVFYDARNNKLIGTMKAFYNCDYSILAIGEKLQRIVTYSNSKIWIWNINEDQSNISSNLFLLRNQLKQLSPKKDIVPGQTIKEKAKIVLDKMNTNLDVPQYSRFISSIERSFLGTNEVVLIENQTLDTLLSEIEKYYTGIFDEADRVQIGKFLTADYIILGSILNVEGKYVLNGKVVNMETAQVLHVFHYIKDNIVQLEESIPDLVEKTIKKVRK